MPGTIYHNNSRTVQLSVLYSCAYSLTHNAYPPYTWDTVTTGYAESARRYSSLRLNGKRGREHALRV